MNKRSLICALTSIQSDCRLLLRISAGRTQPLASRLRRLPVLDAIQHAALLDMACMSGNGSIRHAQKALCDYPCDFETIEVLLSHFFQKSASMRCGCLLLQ